tara:strand:+ start:239 stop:565 length:327 start_codon:yes stop_codon:yes gene_type:complete
MDALTAIKHNKNLLRVASELAGKGNRIGNDKGFDDIEDITPSKNQETQTVSKTEPVEATPEVNETVEAFTNLVMKQLEILDESLEEELVDDDLDFAITTIIDKLISKD